MKKLFTSFYASLIIIVASSFGHYKQVMAVATIGYSTVAHAQFNTEYRPPIKGIFYTGNWSFKDLYSVRDTSSDNDSEFRINMPVVLTKYNSTRNDGLPAYVLHYDASGNIKGSPLSSLITPSTGISYSGGIITNTQPNIVQTLSINSNSVSISGGNTIILPSTKKVIPLTATTNTAGVATFTFSALSVAPNVQYNLGYGAINKETIIPNAAPTTTTNCSYFVQLRSDVLGILPSYAPVSGREVNIVIFEK